MEDKRKVTSYSGIPEYSVLSSEAIHSIEFKTGVLLQLQTPSFMRHTCDCCPKDRAACVPAAGGYIVHDADEGIVAEWLDETMQLSDAISQAIQCAFQIRDVCRIQREKHGLEGPIKIEISAGWFSRERPRGERQVFIILGPAVDELRSAEALAEDCDIVLSPEAWRLCDGEKFTIERIDNEEAVKVWYIIGHDSDSEEDENPSISIPDTLSGYPRRAYLVTNAERENIIFDFMTYTTLDRTHENRNWQELQETWPASILLINLQSVETRIHRSDYHQAASEIIAAQMLRCGGKICNAFFFDEGCIFVALVGLPGDMRQDKTAHALQAAYQIHETCLRDIDNLSSVSVGVTTGRVLYEVEQSPLGNEYKVYGQILCLAANLTVDNPGIVSCDMATILYSKLPLSHLMPGGKISLHEEGHYRKEISEMLADDAAGRHKGLEGRRLALAHLQMMEIDEQTVMKYAIAIGHTFSIKTLKNVLPNMSEKTLIDSLRSLVRAGIIKCASMPMNVSSTETCDCEKNSRECTQVSVDPVGPCQLMSFCNNDEMETVRKMLLKNKRVFQTIHTTCANILEEKAYRCSRCEAKTFMLEVKAATDDNSEHLQEIYSTIQSYEAFQRQGVPSQNQTFSAEGNGNETGNFLAKVESLVMGARDRRTAGSCECAQLVETVLVPRLQHWKRAGHVAKTFYYLLENAAACVYLQNDARALVYLSEARSILKNLKEGMPAFPSASLEYVQICELQQASVRRLTGEILFRAGKIMEAEESFKEVLKLLNCYLPRNTVALSLELIHEKMKKVLYRFKQFTIPEKTELDRLQECIISLSFLWQIHCMRGQLRNASLAVTMEMNLAMQSADPFKILHSAIDYLKYSQLKGEERGCRRLEAFLCRTCGSLSAHPEGRRLIGHLTRTLAVVKLCTGDLEQSVECTMQARQLSEVLNEPSLDVRTTAALHLPLLLTNRYRESVQQILALENLSKGTSSSVAEGWFYAACMNSLLYAGFAFRPFEECLAFVEESQSDANLEADKSLMLHLYSAVALWYARLENWETFVVFFDKAYEVYAQIPTSIESISGVIMLLECSVLFFRKELTERSRQRRSTLRRTKKLFSDFRQRFGKNHIFTPRVLHLKAYLHQLTGSKSRVRDLHKEALLLCEKQGNLLDQRWIRQSQADWSGLCSDTPAEWSTAVLSMQSWDEAAILQPEQLLKNHFCLKKADVKQHSCTLVIMHRLFIK